LRRARAAVILSPSQGSEDRLKTLAAAFVLSLAALPASAQNRFTIDGNLLIYNTSYAVDPTLIDPTSGMTAEDTTGDIAYEDIGALRSILDRNADRIDTMRLTSDGGYIEAAYEMAAIIADYDLKTLPSRAEIMRKVVPMIAATIIWKILQLKKIRTRCPERVRMVELNLLG
jgi:hypothetical protein